MTQSKLLFALILLLCAGVGLMFGTGVLSPDEAQTVAWTEADEITLEAPPPEAMEGNAGELPNGSSRQEIEGELLAAAPAEEDVERPDIRLRGRVVDGFGQPVAAAQVQLEIERNRGGRGGPGRFERQQIRKPVTTGSDGRFAFEGKGFRELRITLQLTHPRFAPTFTEHDFRNAGGDLDLGDVRIRVGGEIRGLVTNLDGSPVAQADVVAHPQGGNRLMWSGSRAELLPPVKTDNNGQFRLEHLMAGDYRVEASATRMLRAMSDRVTVDDELVEEIEPLRLGPGHELQGVVFAPDGKPVQGARVNLTLQDRGSNPGMQRTDQQGRFAFDHLSSGALTMRVQADGYLTWIQSDILPAQAGPITVNLRDGLKITGEVRSAVTNELLTSYGAQVRRIGGLPADQNVVAQSEATFEQLRQQMQSMREQMQQLGPDAPEAQQRRQAMTQQFRALAERMREQERDLTELRNRRGRDGGRDGGRGGRGGGRGGPQQGMNLPGDTGKAVARPDGRFSFGGLDEGIYVVDIGAPDHARLRSQPVELRAGQAVPHLTLVVERGLFVQGVVREASGGEPLAGSDVELMVIRDNGDSPDNPFTALRRQFGPRGFPLQRTKTNAKGEFTIANVPAGRYAVRAQARHHSDATTDTFDLAQDRNGVELSLGALATLHGRVHGIPPHRIEEAAVHVFGGPGNMRNVDVKPDGSYELTDLQPGDLLVRAVVGDMRTVLGSELMQLFGRMRGGNQNGEAAQLPHDVTLAAGERKQLDLQARVEETGTVLGVVMRNGLPAKGLRVTLRTQQTEQNGAEQGRGGRGERVEFAIRGGERFGGRINNFLGRAQNATTDGKGEFRFERVPLGSYDLTVSSGNGRGATELHKETLQVRAEAETRTSVSLLSGVVLGRMKAEADVDATKLTGNVQLLRGIKERPADMQAWNRENQTITVPIRGGSFRSNDVAAGEYLLIATIRGREPVERAIYVTAGGETALELQAGKPRGGGGGQQGR